MSAIDMPVTAPAPARASALPGDPPALLFDAMVAAAIGYAVLALIVASWSQWIGQSPFYIAALLGGNLFFGVSPTPGAAIDPAHVIAYNGAHLGVFVLFGLALALLVRAAERIPQGWYLLGIGMLFAVVHVAAFPLWFDENVRRVLPFSVIAFSTGGAFLAMTAWLVRMHPAVRAAAHEPDEGELR